MRHVGRRASLTFEAKSTVLWPDAASWPFSLEEFCQPQPRPPLSVVVRVPRATSHSVVSMPSLASTARTTAHTSHSVCAGHRARLGRVPDARLPAASRIRAGRVFATGEAAISSSTVDAGEVYSIQSVRDDGEAVVNTAAWLEARSAGDGAVAGVYATYDGDAQMTFVGYRRDVRAAVASHFANNGDDAAKVRVAAFANAQMATRTNLRNEADRWILDWVSSKEGGEECIPKGCLAINAKAWTLAPETWPANEDTAASKAGAGAAGAPTVDPTTGNVVSPYEKESQQSDEPDETPLDPNREIQPLTMENVDAALDAVRPFLQADGGDVEVLGIEDGIVAVRMNGACGSCSSSTATLKGGIEKTLIKVFGNAVRQVVNLDDENGGGAQSLSTEKVARHLEKLAGAIHNYGGSARVVSVTDGVCVLEFKGPLALGQSIASSLKGKFPLLAEVKLKEIE